MILSITILLCIIGIIVTYIVTRKRAEWVKKNTYNKGALFDEDQDVGVMVFSMLSFIGLVVFLLIRIISIMFKVMDKLVFNDK